MRSDLGTQLFRQDSDLSSSLEEGLGLESKSFVKSWRLGLKSPIPTSNKEIIEFVQ